MRKFIASILIILFSNVSFASQSEEKFKEIFTAAGYSTILGAAIGAAMLAFRSDPEDNLRFIALGASLGFFVGLGIGSYFALEPIWAQNDIKKEFYLSQNTRPIVIKPMFLGEKFVGIGAQIAFLKF